MIYYRKGLPLLTGDTPADRYDYLVRHASNTERRQMAQRRAERIKWLRIFNPAALPVALRSMAA